VGMLCVCVFKGCMHVYMGLCADVLGGVLRVRGVMSMCGVEDVWMGVVCVCVCVCVCVFSCWQA